jgi:hypothetical protein
MAKCRHTSYGTRISARKAAESATEVKVRPEKCTKCGRWRLVVD